MQVYIPVFSGNWKVQEIESKNARFRHTCGYNPMIIDRGTIYSGAHIYTDPRGVELYISKEYGRAAAYEIDAAKIQWKGVNS